MLLYGSGSEKINFYYDDGARRFSHQREFMGVIPNLDRRYRETDSPQLREELSQYMNTSICPDCSGSRLRQESLFIKIDNLAICIHQQHTVRRLIE